MSATCAIIDLQRFDNCAALGVPPSLNDVAKKRIATKSE